jgi:hypothetical protein
MKERKTLFSFISFRFGPGVQIKSVEENRETDKMYKLYNIGECESRGAYSQRAVCVMHVQKEEMKRTQRTVGGTREKQKKKKKEERQFIHSYFYVLLLLQEKKKEKKKEFFY